uniref:Sulfotransferase domain-containing protein n=1 Tax=Pseudo-nitzschia multistriata TaxID=183589 RepID=A0A448Z5D3_9STRA
MGSNLHGYLPHLTARKIIDYGYVSEDRFEEVSTFAIVRNPYARMVSLYMYNRFGPWESFSDFVRTWYDRTIKDYREHGKMEEWDTPCHAIPQFEFTHDANGTKQLVHSVIKQEELKCLKKASKTGSDFVNKTRGDVSKDVEVNDENHDDGHTVLCSMSSSDSSQGKSNVEHTKTNDAASIRCLPDPVRCALLGMPHENKRKTKTPWYEHYDQETLNLTYEMYHRDFEIFGYNVVLEQRPDLEPPTPVVRDVCV